MIKTVSFAPPRPARAAKANGKSASKTAAPQPARAASVATATVRPPARVSSGSSLAPTVTPSTGAKTNAPRRRAAAPKIAPEIEANLFTIAEDMPAEVAPAAIAPKTAAPRKARASKAANVEIAPAEVAPAEAAITEVAPAEAAPAIAATAPKSGALTLKTPAKKRAKKAIEAATQAEAASAEVASAEAAPAEAASAEAASTEAAPTEVASAEAAPIATPRIKRSRAPKDLAAQYGVAPETEIAPRVIADKPAPRKRMTREAKAARSQMLRPDDDVLQRLQQANSVEVKKPASRGRGWEFECGCCGRITRFQTPAAICECGAIAVKE